MKVALGGDHAGFEVKQQVAGLVVELGHELLDVGAHAYDALDDYPDFSEAVARAVVDGHAERGILICGSGIGACIAANKVPGARAGICTETYSAHQGVEHDDMNVLVLAARVTGIEPIKEIVGRFLGASFSGEERHVRRLNKVLAIERQGIGRV
jgi:ribose 5-phosphate isomerase B